MKITRLLAALLAVLMLASVLAGCGDSGEGSGSSSGAQSGGSGDELLEVGEVKLPITDEVTNFDIWVGYGVPVTGMTDVDAEVLAYQEAERRTNIHVEITCPPASDIQAQFNLSIASGDYYDSYQTTNTLWSSGFDYYVENEIIYDLNNYMDYLPNYDAVRRMDAATFPTTVTDNGYAPGIFMIAKTMQWAVLGPMVRGDYLNDLGLSNPETYDELHDVLAAFRDNGVEAPLLASTSGFDDWLMVGYDTMYSGATDGATAGHGSAQFVVDDNGVVSFSMLRDGAYDYIKMMNQWYNEGLLESDFYSTDDDLFTIMGRVQNDQVGVLRTLYSANDMYKPGAIDPDFQMIGLNIPTKQKGDQVKISFGAAPLTLNKECISTISTACENVETLCRWYDYFWTEEGSLLGNYGVENESYIINAEGKPELVENIYANPEGQSLLNMLYMNAFYPMQGIWYDWERELAPNTSAETLGTKEAWSKNVSAEHNMPGVTLTSEESTEASALLGDCYTYIDEMVLKFIIGTEPLDNWDEYVETLQSLGIDRATAIMQAAYDRYSTR